MRWKHCGHGVNDSRWTMHDLQVWIYVTELNETYLLSSTREVNCWKLKLSKLNPSLSSWTLLLCLCLKFLVDLLKPNSFLSRCFSQFQETNLSLCIEVRSQWNPLSWPSYHPWIWWEKKNSLFRLGTLNHHKASSLERDTRCSDRFIVMIRFSK